MAKRCPPGVICIENITVIFLISIFVIVAIYYFSIQKKNLKQPKQIIIREIVNNNIPNPQRNVLLNPFTPPLRDGGFFPPTTGDPRGIPINIKTRGYDDHFRQVGLLTRINGPETILPLMGRPLHSNRNKWQFYTMSDKNNSVKLPVSRNGKSCTNEYGCNDLFNGDTIYTEGYNDAFKVTIYDNYLPRYIPFL